MSADGLEGPLLGVPYEHVPGSGTDYRPARDDAAVVEFLLARLDEDEQAARAATPGPWTASEFYPGAGAINSATGNIANESAEGDVYLADAEHIARHHPARVLVEVKAKRAIVEAWRLWGDNPSGEMRDYGHEEGLEEAIELLAAVYTEHPDYQPEWKP